MHQLVSNGLIALSDCEEFQKQHYLFAAGGLELALPDKCNADLTWLPVASMPAFTYYCWWSQCWPYLIAGGFNAGIYRLMVVSMPAFTGFPVVTMLEFNDCRWSECQHLMIDVGLNAGINWLLVVSMRTFTDCLCSQCLTWLLVVSMPAFTY